MQKQLHLGLIGDNIMKSQSPRLHRLAGQQIGLAVTYDRLVPKEEGLTFDQLFAKVAKAYRGVNITYPYKERAASKVTIQDPLVAAIGAVNTVLFEPEGPQGFNTDYTGFIAAYRHIRGVKPPGKVLLIGAGGVGRAIAFGLIALHAEEIRIADVDGAKAQALADALLATRPSLIVKVNTNAADLTADLTADLATGGIDGIANGTPIGMVGIGGTPLPRTAMQDAQWVFDAVYTPVETPFLIDAAQEGLAIISGYELFFGQGIDAWRHFSGQPIDPVRLRQSLEAGEDTL